MNISKKKMTLIAYIFPKLWTPKNVVRSISKKSCFRKPFEKQCGKRDQTLLKSERQQYYSIYWSLRRQLSWKKSLLVICKIVRLRVNTLTADENHSLLNRDNLTQPIQILLSEKQKAFLKFSFAFSKYAVFEKCG